MLGLLRRVPSSTSPTAVVDAVVEHGSVAQAERALVPPSLFDDSEVRERARADIEAWRSQGIDVHAFTDSSYPAALREVVEAPPLVFTRGEVRCDDVAVAVVGSRRASDASLVWTADLATAIAREGVTVASGAAFGVDEAAHRAALAAGGRTVAVLGTGVDRCYPPGHENLQEDIAARGMLLSQFLPGAPGTKRSFPARNAVMSGYSVATVIVEAGERSGARTQARVAVEHGRQVLLTRAVAESTSWAAALTRRAAVQVVASVEDAVDKLGKILRSHADPHAEFMDDLGV